MKRWMTAAALVTLGPMAVGCGSSSNPGSQEPDAAGDLDADLCASKVRPECGGCCGSSVAPECTANGWTCPGVACTTCPDASVDGAADGGDGGEDGGACGQSALAAFVAANDSCTSGQGCVPLCQLGASCDTGSVNEAGAAAFKSTFAACSFPQCAIDCAASGTCTGGKCQ